MRNIYNPSLVLRRYSNFMVLRSINDLNKHQK